METPYQNGFYLYDIQYLDCNKTLNIYSKHTYSHLLVSFLVYIHYLLVLNFIYPCLSKMAFYGQALMNMNPINNRNVFFIFYYNLQIM